MKHQNKYQHLLKYSDEVRDALAVGKPVVAVESSVISNGLPYPYNLEAAQKVEAAIRVSGSVPATIGIEKGRFLIGMDSQDIDRFAQTPGISKTSSRDVPILLASGKMGATTVASSLIATDLAGISFFASAGIGGVHRGAEKTMDISADLIQFTRSKVAVVCAGAKSILDLPLTLEYLETQCVPVIAYKSDDFPAFYCRSSGIRLPHRLDDPSAIAKVIEMHWALCNNSSVLITHPIKDSDALDSEEFETAIAAAMVQAEKDAVKGPAITPYLMKYVSKMTEGRTVKANMSVLISTAEVAGFLAKAHAGLKQPANV